MQGGVRGGRQARLFVGILRGKGSGRQILVHFSPDAFSVCSHHPIQDKYIEVSGGEG